MVLTDPSRMQADLFRVDCLGNDIRYEFIGTTRVVSVVIIAQCEIAEFDFVFSRFRSALERSPRSQSQPIMIIRGSPAGQPSACVRSVVKQQNPAPDALSRFDTLGPELIPRLVDVSLVAKKP
jgi:hypothetical protein